MGVDPASGRLCFRLGSREVGITTDGFDEARKAQDERAKAEELRLLYVAATRARDALVLPVFPSKKTGFLATLLGAFPRLGERDATLGPGDGGPVRAVDEELVPVAGNPPVFRIAAAALEAALETTAAPPVDDPDALRLSRNLAARTHARAVAPVTTLVHLDSDYVGPKTSYGGDAAKAIGTSVHRALEVMDLDDPDGVSRAAMAEARAKGLPGPLVERAGVLARAALDLPSLQRARRSPRVLREWPFALRGDAWILEGVLDLAWVEDGALVILDYKTDAVATPAEIVLAAAHHTPQLLAYAWALGKVLKLPVKEVVLAFVAAKTEHCVPVTADDLAAAGRAIESGFLRLAADAGPR